MMRMNNDGHTTECFYEDKMIRELNQDGHFDEESKGCCASANKTEKSCANNSKTGSCCGKCHDFTEADLSPEGRDLPAKHLADTVRDALKNVKDPEIGMDLVTLNLIYSVKTKGDRCKIIMTFTTPMCPFGPAMVDEVREAALKVKGVSGVEVEVTFEPPWQPTDEVKMMLGI